MRKVISMPLVFLGDRAKSLDNFKIMKMKDKNIMNILKTKDLTSRMLHSTIFQPRSMELDKINLKTNSHLTNIKKKLAKLSIWQEVNRLFKLIWKINLKNRLLDQQFLELKKLLSQSLQLIMAILSSSSPNHLVQGRARSELVALQSFEWAQLQREARRRSSDLSNLDPQHSNQHHQSKICSKRGLKNWRRQVP